MILVDTNIVSEIMRPRPFPAVMEWLDAQDGDSLFLSAVSIAEIGYGLRILPDGQRCRDLRQRFEDFVARGFAHRILDFTESAAHIYAEIMGSRKEIGRPMSLLDGQIAAIARTHRFTLATRNVTDFRECGVPLINPFVHAA